MRKLLTPLKAEEKESKRTKPVYEEIGEAFTLELEEDSTASLVFSASKDTSKVGSSPHLDIRTWVDSERYSGPTKKGINFDVINTPDVLALILAKYLECPEGRLQKVIDSINENVLEGEGIKLSIEKE